MRSNQEGADSQAYCTLPFHPAGLERLESLFAERGDGSRLAFHSCGEFSASISPPLQGQQAVLKLRRNVGGAEKTMCDCHIGFSPHPQQIGGFGASQSRLRHSSNFLAQLLCNQL